jgi:hypothetical protein
LTGTEAKFLLHLRRRVSELDGGSAHVVSFPAQEARKEYESIRLTKTGRSHGRSCIRSETYFAFQPGLRNTEADMMTILDSRL